jgi:RelB Antitoxin alpha helical domain
MTALDAAKLLLAKALEDEALLKAMQETEGDELFDKEQALLALSEA